MSRAPQIQPMKSDPCVWFPLLQVVAAHGLKTNVKHQYAPISPSFSPSGCLLIFWHLSSRWAFTHIRSTHWRLIKTMSYESHQEQKLCFTAATGALSAPQETTTFTALNILPALSLWSNLIIRYPRQHNLIRIFQSTAEWLMYKYNISALSSITHPR